MKQNKFTRAITREPGPNFASGLTTSNLGSPDYALVKKQHQAYVAILQSLGVEVEVLPPLPKYPDAYFVEDVAVVTPTIGVITRPGAEERLGEEAFIEAALAQHLPTVRIQTPGTLDGGDVLQVGNDFYIGTSARTNEEGARQLSEFLQQHGYACVILPVWGGLHLKSDVSYIGRNTILITETSAGAVAFAQYDKILIDEEEAYAANSLLVNGSILTPQGFPNTRNKLLDAQFDIIEVETSELQKMDGGLSCLSLRF